MKKTRHMIFAIAIREYSNLYMPSDEIMTSLTWKIREKLKKSAFFEFELRLQFFLKVDEHS